MYSHLWIFLVRISPSRCLDEALIVIALEIDVLLEASEYPINPKTPKNLAEWGVIPPL